MSSTQRGGCDRRLKQVKRCWKQQLWLQIVHLSVWRQSCRLNANHGGKQGGREHSFCILPRATACVGSQTAKRWTLLSCGVIIDSVAPLFGLPTRIYMGGVLFLPPSLRLFCFNTPWLLLRPGKRLVAALAALCVNVCVCVCLYVFTHTGCWPRLWLCNVCSPWFVHLAPPVDRPVTLCSCSSLHAPRLWTCAVCSLHAWCVWSKTNFI